MDVMNPFPILWAQVDKEWIVHLSIGKEGVSVPVVYIFFCPINDTPGKSLGGFARGFQKTEQVLKPADVTLVGRPT
jgi:hypothetical protein